MTPSGRYLAGLAGVGIAGASLAALAGSSRREEIAVGLLIGLLIQAPLGWWTLRSIGTEKFQLVWAGGMLIRLLAVAVAALVLVPVFHWDLSAFLLALVVTLLALLLVEAATAVREHSTSKA